jgi:hypothetical protein
MSCLPNGGEDVAFASQGGVGGRDERRVAHVGRMILFVNGHQPRRVERAVDQVQIVLCQAQRAQQGLADCFGAIVIGFQADGVAFAAVVQFFFNGLEQIAAVLFVDVKLAVARDAKMPVAEDARAGKQIPQEMAHDLAQKNVIAPSVGARQFHHRRQNARRLHDGQMAQVFRAGLHLQLHDDVERFVEQLREGMVGIDGQRREHWTHFAAIKILQPFQVGLAQSRRRDKADAVAGEFRHKFFAPAKVLLTHHAPDALLGGAQSLGGRPAVGAARVDLAFDLLFEAGHAHLGRIRRDWNW